MHRNTTRPFKLTLKTPSPLSSRAEGHRPKHEGLPIKTATYGDTPGYLGFGCRDFSHAFEMTSCRGQDETHQCHTLNCRSNTYSSLVVSNNSRAMPLSLSLRMKVEGHTTSPVTSNRRPKDTLPHPCHPEPKTTGRSVRDLNASGTDLGNTWPTLQ